MHLNNAINEVYEAYERDKDVNKGMLPVISCSGTTAMKDKAGTNYKPNLSIIKWAARPAELESSYEQSAPVTPTAPAKAANSVSEF